MPGVGSGPIQIIDADMGLALLSVATSSVACGSGTEPDRLVLTHDKPVWSGQPFHIFYSRECLAIAVGRSLTSDDVLETLTGLFTRYGPPAHIRSDNGPELTAKVVRDWLKDLGVKTLFIEPGSPWENGYNESFNGTLGEEILKREIFLTLSEAKVLIEQWRREYDTIRPHSSLGYRPPAPEAIRPDPDFLNLPTFRGPHPQCKEWKSVRQ